MIDDAARLALGTLTAWPVRPPARVDRRVAGWAMALGPAAGALLGLVGLVAGLLVAGLYGPVLVAALVVALLGLLTRLIHWDGLADTADGLGTGGSPAVAQEVMRRGDVGPFGVFAIVLVLVVEVAALADLVARGAVAGVLVAVVLGRWTLGIACSSRFHAARPDGLGAAVAGSVGAPQLTVAAVTTAAVVVGVGFLGGQIGWWSLAAAGVLTTLWAAAGTAYLSRRLGGMTGDTLGALVESSTAVALVVLAAG